MRALTNSETLMKMNQDVELWSPEQKLAARRQLDILLCRCQCGTPIDATQSRCAKCQTEMSKLRQWAELENPDNV